VRQFAERPLVFDVQTDYGRIRLSNSVLESPGGSRYLLQVGVTLVPMDRALGRFLALLALGVPAGLIAAFLIGRVMAGIALRPLTQLAGATRRIGVQELLQLPVRGARDELDDVAMAFNETLRRLDRAIGEMRQFSAALAHELRTPLTALRGEIELAMLKAGVEPEAQRLGSQLEEIDRLKRLIDRVLLLARAEAGEIPLSREPVHLGALVQSLVEQIEPIAGAKGLGLESHLAENTIVVGDSAWLERAILNLLDNAIKFTPAGGRVVVTLVRGRAEATLTVRDTGIGIDPALAPHVFEPFVRADSARSSGVEGTGLGLSLAKWIIDRHHGRIQITSRPGEGSTFDVTLPLAG
jgi:two-component system OmpR family sensor kinase